MRLRPTIPRLLQVVLLSAKYMGELLIADREYTRAKAVLEELQLSPSAVRSAQTIPICCILVELYALALRHLGDGERSCRCKTGNAPRGDRCLDQKRDQRDRFRCGLQTSMVVISICFRTVI